MASRQPLTTDWRMSAKRLAGQLDKAHSAVDVLRAALDEGDGPWAKNVEQMAHETVDFVADSVKRFEVMQPSTDDDLNVTGSSLALGGGGVATVALDVIVNAMVALASTDNRDDIDFLVSVSIDAEEAYEVGVAVMEAAPNTDRSGVADLLGALGTEGNNALAKRVVQARPRVLAIKKRVA